MAKNEAKEILDLVLHPVRLRILVALAGGKGMTPLQIADQLHDIPQASLYRHINRMLKLNVLKVVEERPVRGTLEKVYALAHDDGSLVSAEALSEMSKADHLRFFTSFVATLLDDFSRYLEHSPKVDLAADGVGYTKASLYLDDSEFAELGKALNKDIAIYLGNEPVEGRKKRLLSLIVIPDHPGLIERRK
jgi:DNA-binding transcriptional ArsR family regulator